MKKLIAFLLALSCLFVLCACGEKDEKEDNEEKDTVLDLPELAQKISEEIGVIMPQLPENKAYDLGPSEETCEEVYVYSDVDFNKSNELWLIKAKDEASLEQVKSFAQNRVDYFLSQQSYNADVANAAKEAKIEVRGLYLMLCITTAGDAAAVAGIFNNA